MRTKIIIVLISGIIGTLVVFSSCSESTDTVRIKSERAEYMSTLENNLHSRKWQIRYDALEAAKSLGWQAHELTAQFLSDRSDVISRTAQSWFVDQGEQALDYLVNKLLSVEEDAGLYASIAGGKEKNRGKSLAGSIWLILVRGLSRDRCYEIMKGLVSHPSPKIRAIVLHTAASLRNNSFLEFFDHLSKDEDSLVREKFKVSLVRLLILDWYSTPELDEPSVSHCLTLLEPELPAIMETDIHADFVPRFPNIVTLGEVLGRDALPFHREEFISMLAKALPHLSEKGAQRAGTAFQRQCWIVKDRDRYVNSAWIEFAGKRLRDSDRLKGIFDKLIKRLETEQTKKARRNYIAALSQFPFELYNEQLAQIFFDSDLILYKSSSHSAIRFYLKAIKDKNDALREKALAVLKNNLNQKDEQKVLEALYAGLFGIRFSSSEKSSQLKNLFSAQADHLFSLSKSISIKDLVTFLDLFIHLEDERYFKIFERAWSFRHSEDLDAAKPISRCIRLLSSRKDRRIFPYLIEYINEGSEVIHTGLKVSCVYNLLRSLSAPSQIEPPAKTLRPELFERWIDIIQNPEEHPRVKAAFAELLHYPLLSKEQKKRLVNIYLKLTREPQDWNLRSKACLNLGKIGERRIIPVAYEMLMSDDAPTWVYLNCLSGLYNLETKGKKGDEAQIKAGAGRAIELLETLLGMYPEPQPKAKIIHVNNYYSWAVLYHIYSPLMVLQSLRSHTGQDFGYNIAAWKKWLKTGTN